MNKLAHFVYGLTNGNETNYGGLSKLEETVVRELRPILVCNPEGLAIELSKLEAQGEEWLVPPPVPSID